jgi:hypothetical protein
MTYNPIGRNFNELLATNLDASTTDTETEGLDISQCSLVAMSVAAVSGTHSNHIVTLQCAMVDVDAKYVDTSTTITGEGVQDNVQITAKYVRGKVTTAEGGASVIDITIQAK